MSDEEKREMALNHLIIVAGDEEFAFDILLYSIQAACKYIVFATRQLRGGRDLGQDVFQPGKILSYGEVFPLDVLAARADIDADAHWIDDKYVFEPEAENQDAQDQEEDEDEEPIFSTDEKNVVTQTEQLISSVYHKRNWPGSTFMPLQRMIDAHAQDFEVVWGKYGILYNKYDTTYSAAEILHWEEHELIQHLVRRLKNLCQKLMEKAQEVQAQKDSHGSKKRRRQQVHEQHKRRQFLGV